MYPSRFSSYLGIPSDRSAIIGMLLSGALGGLAGAIEVLGAVRGFDGILIGILGKLEPIGAIIASLFYGAIKNGGFYVDYKTDVAREIIIVLISILIFFVSAQKIVKGLEKYPIVKKMDSFFSRKKM